MADTITPTDGAGEGPTPDAVSRDAANALFDKSDMVGSKAPAARDAGTTRVAENPAFDGKPATAAAELGSDGEPKADGGQIPEAGYRHAGLVPAEYAEHLKNGALDDLLASVNDPTGSRGRAHPQRADRPRRRDGEGDQRSQRRAVLGGGQALG